MNVLLISTYELGRQPFGLASPAAWLAGTGARVRCLDLAVEHLDEEAVRAAELVAFYLPMHTATRLAARLLPGVRALNPGAHLCFYGLYAPLNEPYLRELGAGTVLGGEFEAGLLRLVQRLGAGRRAHADANGHGHTPLQPEPLVSLARQDFRVPERSGLPALARYARLNVGDGRERVVGYTEASRGCKHLCRHCPIPAVYGGRFRIVQREVVLEDIRRQVAAGAEHITFGDPDFFNGVGHARALVRALHAEHPRLTYDVTIKVEHLLKHARELSLLRDTGCLFVTTAVESIDDRVLAILDKGHTRADFLEVVRLCRAAGLGLNPTFVAFTPWISIAGYRELLAFLADLDLVENVAPIQLAIRLLIPAGSKLLELDEVREIVRPIDRAALVHPWRHEDPAVDRLQALAERLVQEATARGESRTRIFSRIRGLAEAAAGLEGPRVSPELQQDERSEQAKGKAGEGPGDHEPARAAVPYLTEPWYC